MKPVLPASPQLSSSSGIELPTWAFRRAGRPRNSYEVVADAAVVQRFAGGVSRLAAYLPDDYVDNYHDLSLHAAEYGLAFSSVHPPVKLSSLVEPEGPARSRVVASLMRAARLANEVGATQLVLRLTDQCRYQGRHETVMRRRRLIAALTAVLDELKPSSVLVIEMPHWHQAQRISTEVGARVLVQIRSDDTGHGIGTLHATDQLGRVVIDELGKDNFAAFLTVADIAEVGDSARIAVEPIRWDLPDAAALMHLVALVGHHMTAVAKVDFSRDDLGVRLARAYRKVCTQSSAGLVAAYEYACREQFHAAARHAALRRSTHRRNGISIRKSKPHQLDTGDGLVFESSPGGVGADGYAM
ncbi:MAG: hypothetical protein HOQ05_13120 [Corynebacteriales bacterium]|nr:hypothetical protein [Mycobacteriales bacterium]